MKRRNFITSSAAVAASAFVGSSVSARELSKSQKEIYEFRIYQLAGGAGKKQLQKYISNALIPLMNQYNVKVGAFGEYDQEDPPKIYILFAYPNFETYLKVQTELTSNKEYLSNAKAYFDIPANKPVFERYDTFLTEAFSGLPSLKVPAKNRGLFELRTYESYNEDAARRKIMMFDNEEIPLFQKVGLHPVFFSKVLAGKYMPALMYMLWFEDMEQRNAHWDKFRVSDEWNTMKGKDIYANTVSKVRKKFLVPLEYSQI